MDKEGWIIGLVIFNLLAIATVYSELTKRLDKMENFLSSWKEEWDNLDYEEEDEDLDDESE